MCSRKWSTIAVRAWSSVSSKWPANRRRTTPPGRWRRGGGSWPSTPASTSTPTGRPRLSTPSSSARSAIRARLRSRGCTANTVRISHAGGGVLGPRPLPPMIGTSRRYICPLTNRTSIVSSGAPIRSKPSRIPPELRARSAPPSAGSPSCRSATHRSPTSPGPVVAMSRCPRRHPPRSLGQNAVAGATA